MQNAPAKAAEASASEWIGSDVESNASSTPPRRPTQQLLAIALLEIHARLSEKVRRELDAFEDDPLTFDPDRVAELKADAEILSRLTADLHREARR